MPSTFCTRLSKQVLHIQGGPKNEATLHLPKYLENYWRYVNDFLHTGTGSRCCGNEGCDGKDQRIRILSAAESVSIDDIPGCPSIRACPKCGLLIYLKEGCRHMTCTGCGAEFCFICLKKWKVSLRHRLSACPVAPVQTTLTDPLWDQRNDDVNEASSSNNSNCVILWKHDYSW